MVQEAKPMETTQTGAEATAVQVPPAAAPVVTEPAGAPAVGKNLQEPQPAPAAPEAQSASVQPEVIPPGIVEIRMTIKRDFLERSRKVAAYAASARVIDGDEHADNFPVWVAYCLVMGEEMLKAQFKKGQNGSTA
jgi:hypothetical protein